MRGFLGLIVAMMVGVISYFDNEVLEEAFLDATAVLFWWYVAFGIQGVVLTLLVIMGLTSGAAILGIESSGSRGGVAAGAAVGSVGVVILMFAVVLAGMSVAGAYFLHGSVELTHGVYVWQVPQAIIGAVFIGISIAVTKARS